MNWKKITAFGTTALCATSLFAETYIWSGGGDGTSWSDAANWGGVVPTSTDYAKFSTIAGTDPITVTPGTAESMSVKNLQFGAGANIYFNLKGTTLATSTAGEQTILAADTTYVVDGGTLNVKTVSNKNNALVFNKDTVLNLVNGATFSVDKAWVSNSPFTLNISGGSKFTSAATSTYYDY